jgi:hypothetical protein
VSTPALEPRTRGPCGLGAAGVCVWTTHCTAQASSSSKGCRGTPHPISSFSFVFTHHQPHPHKKSERMPSSSEEPSLGQSDGEFVGERRRAPLKHEKSLGPRHFSARGVFCAAPLAQPRAAPALPSPSLSSLPSAGVSRRGPSALPPESLGAQTTREKFLRPSCPALLGGRGRLRRARRADVDAVLGPGHEDEVGPPNTPTNAVLTPTPLPPLPPPPSQPTASPGRSGRWRS